MDNGLLISRLLWTLEDPTLVFNGALDLRVPLTFSLPVSIVYLFSITRNMQSPAAACLATFASTCGSVTVAGVVQNRQAS